MPNELKSHKKPKVFRIDGDIDIDTWINLVSLFFKGNEMILEYFDPEQFELVFREDIEAFKTYKP